MPIIHDIDPSLRRKGAAGRAFELSESRRNHNNNNNNSNRAGGAGPPPPPPPPPPRGRAVLDDLDFDFEFSGAATSAASATSAHPSPRRGRPQQPNHSNSRRGGARSIASADPPEPAADAPTSSSLSPSARRNNRDLGGSQLESIGDLGLLEASAQDGGGAARGLGGGGGGGGARPPAAAANNNNNNNNDPSNRSRAAGSRPTGSSLLDLRGLPGGHSAVAASRVILPPHNAAAHYRRRTQAQIVQLQQTVARLEGEAAGLRAAAASRDEELEAARAAQRLSEGRAAQLERDCRLTIQRQRSQMQSLVEESRADAEATRSELEGLRRHVDGRLGPDLERKTQEMKRLQDSHNFVVQMLQDKERRLEEANGRLQLELDEQAAVHKERVDALAGRIRAMTDEDDRRVGDLEQENRRLLEQNRRLLEELRRATAGGTGRHERRGSSESSFSASDADDDEEEDDDDFDDRNGTKNGRHGRSESKSRPRSRPLYPQEDAPFAAARRLPEGKPPARRSSTARELEDLQRSNAHYDDGFYESSHGPVSYATATPSIGAGTGTGTGAAVATYSSSGKQRKSGSGGSGSAKDPRKKKAADRPSQAETDFVLRITKQNSQRAVPGTAAAFRSPPSQERSHAVRAGPPTGVLGSLEATVSSAAARAPFSTPLAGAAPRPRPPRPAGGGGGGGGGGGALSASELAPGRRRQDAAGSHPSHPSRGYASAPPAFRAATSGHRQHHPSPHHPSLSLSSAPAFRGPTESLLLLGSAAFSPPETGSRKRPHEPIRRRRAPLGDVPTGGPFRPLFRESSSSSSSGEEASHSSSGLSTSSSSSSTSDFSAPPNHNEAKKKKKKRRTSRIVIESPDSGEGTDDHDDDYHDGY